MPCEHQNKGACEKCWDETCAENVELETKLSDAEFDASQAKTDRDEALYEAREGFIDRPADVPDGWKGEITHYPDEPRCEVRLTITHDGRPKVLSYDLRQLPGLLLQALAREQLLRDATRNLVEADLEA